MKQLRQLIADAAAALGRLSPRERSLVAIAGAALLTFVIAVFSLTVSRAIDSRERRIEAKRRQLEEVARLSVTFKQQETVRNELDRRLAQNKVKLFSYLEELGRKDNVSIGGMTDKGSQPLQEGTKITESSVEVTFTHIQLDKLVRFLTDIETGQGLVKVTRLQVRPRSDEPVLDAWLVVTTYTLES
jgi:general secretion pathway protein M